MLAIPEGPGREGNRRDLLVRVGSWVKYSWRRSRESLTDNDDDDDDFGKRRRHRRHQADDDGDCDANIFEDDEDDNDCNRRTKKHAHFNTLEGEDEVMVTVIPCREEDCIVSEDEMKERWFQNYDAVRFEKDRVLTSIGYNAANHSYLGSSSFDENEHSIRGIEHLCDKSLGQRLAAERKDLYRALAAEEARQKEDESFPNLEQFRRVSLRHSKGGKERALAAAQEDARFCGQRTNSGSNNKRRIHSAMNPFSR